MNKLTVSLAKYIMKLSESQPSYNSNIPYSENIKHKEFLNGTDEQKKQILFNMSEAQYRDEEELPLDLYFPNVDLKELMKGKTVLDLGCFCGGKAVAYAERWQCKEVHGMDIRQEFIDAANYYCSTRKNQHVHYKFFTGFGEAIPVEENTYDCIISFDVFEHVKSLKETLNECIRVLKPGGVLLAAFPSYYSFNEHHLGFVTKNPIIHWFFSADTLNEAYMQIVEERGEEAYWYKNTSKEPWQKLGCGIGTNGNTFNSLNKTLKKVPYSSLVFVNTPIGSRGLRSQKSKLIRWLSNYIINPVSRLPIFKELLSHRIVFQLKK